MTAIENEIRIVKETDNYLVIDKPYGLVVNRAESIKGKTVQDWVESRSWFVDRRSSISDKVFLDRSGICHRIDKETSGCLLIAKNPTWMLYFLDIFQKRKIKKEYLALVHGRVEPNEGEIVLPMKRSIFEREKWHVHYEGKKAISNWQVIEYFDWPTENVRWKNCLSLLKVGLKTGRTHQIRVHFSFLGWPLFGDDKYLQKQQSAADRDLLKRHFLHANKIAFEEMDGQKVEIVSGLPDECEELLAKIKSG